MHNNFELIKRFKVGERVPVYVNAPDGYAGRNAELLPRLQVSFYDDDSSNPPVRLATNLSEAVGLVRERYPSAHFRDGLSSNDIVRDPKGSDGNDCMMRFEFFPDSAAFVRSDIEPPGSLAQFTVGVVKWFVKLHPLTEEKQQ